VWAQEEDEAIRALVMKHGTKTWSVIAEQIVKEYGIQGRTGKQCRERWHNHLGIKRDIHSVFCNTVNHYFIVRSCNKQKFVDRGRRKNYVGGA